MCKNSNPSELKKKLLQKCKYWDLTKNAFGCISLVLVGLQKPTVPHLKDKFIINNSFNELKAVRVNIKSPDLKISVQIIMHNPLSINYISTLVNLILALIDLIYHLSLVSGGHTCQGNSLLTS